MKPIEAEVRLRNNRLKKARERLEMTQKDVAIAVGIPIHAVGGLETFKNSPRNKITGEWTKAALALADFFCENPEFLFPDETLNLEGRPTVQRVELDVEDIPEILLGQSISQLPEPEEYVMKLETTERIQEIICNSDALNPREKLVIEMIYGLNGQKPHSLAEVAKKLNVTKSRISQIEYKVLRKLRHPRFAHYLRDLDY